MGKRILCAEDEKAIRDMLTAAFTDDGHEVHAVPNGAEALALAQAGAFDILVTDHQMPVMNGLALVQGLRALAFRGKIVVFSGALLSAARKDYTDLKVDAIIAKPSELGLLTALVRGG